ncbi:MAG TPA: COQ9 family protein [Sphingomicrobium sp.]|nr:COQ9 family protein [Sphingomicrobium sp.]
MDATDPQPSPLEKIRDRIALAVGENAVFDGWTAAAVDSAAARLGIDPAQARLAFPKGRAEMFDAYVQGVDREMARRLPAEKLAAMKIREKIRALVWARLEIMGGAREAIRSGLSVLAMPHNAPLGLRIGWRSADLMWRLAGDASSDFNHYTKRMTLGAVYASTLLAWLDDDSDGWIETAGFLDRRIDNVMQFEKWKAQWRGQERFSVSRFLGRLRYPPR